MSAYVITYDLCAYTYTLQGINYRPFVYGANVFKNNLHIDLSFL